MWADYCSFYQIQNFWFPDGVCSKRDKDVKTGVWKDPIHEPKQFRMVVKLCLPLRNSPRRALGDWPPVSCAWQVTHVSQFFSSHWNDSFKPRVSFPIWTEICGDLTETKMDPWMHTLSTAACKQFFCYEFTIRCSRCIFLFYFILFLFFSF